jgi:maleylpyruvate isomerase
VPSPDPLVLVPHVRLATDRLLRTAATLDDTALAQPSLLPGWTRGHVLAHVARNADSYVRLLTGARTGEDIPQYASEAARDAEIDAGAGRPLAAHLADLRASADGLVDAFAAMPAAAWVAPVRGRGASPRSAAGLVWARLREVEVHHVDLDAGYRPADWDEAFTLRLLHELETGFTSAPPLRLRAEDLDRDLRVGPAGGGTPVTVSGPGHAVAAWLIGRADGSGLTVSPDGPLPPVPTWR